MFIRGNIFRNIKFIVRFHHTNQEVRVRFAPSPTGYLHLGGLRTAVYNFLYAKSRRGKFLLRIEDTDQTRIVQGAREQLQKDLNWAGIHIDEGPSVGGAHGPYIQSQRLKIYRDQIDILLETGLAYPCFCTNKRLELLRLEALRSSAIPKYDNRCRHLSKEEVEKKLRRKDSYCVRFKLTPGVHTFEDVIYGSVSYDVVLNEGDPVIFKSDGFPTYHFANVVDDHFMKITHVLRGVEWQISTTKHIMMYKAFNWTPPVYGHLPLLLNADGTKLSKRQGDIRIESYRNNGIFPQALVNFITHSGGGFEKDHERCLKPRSYTMEELAQQFDLKQVNSHSGKLMPERLLEFNRLELERQINNSEELNLLVIKVQNLVREKFPERVADNTLKLDEDYIKSVLTWTASRVDRLSDLVSNQLSFLWIAPSNIEKKSREELKVILKLKDMLVYQEDLSKDRLKQTFRNFAKENEIKFSSLMQLTRSILSGLKEGPSVAEMIEILGKENTLLRLETYIKKNST